MICKQSEEENLFLGFSIMEKPHDLSQKGKTYLRAIFSVEIVLLDIAYPSKCK